MALHFPDLALNYDNELLVDSQGQQWRLSTASHHNHLLHSYTLLTRLEHDEKTIAGHFMVSEGLFFGLEKDEDLRVLVIGEIKKYLNRGELTTGFIKDLP